MKNRSKEAQLHLTSERFPKIRTQENLYAILDHALDLLCVIDQDGYFVLVNSAAQRILGYHKSELLGTAYSKLVYTDDLAKTEGVALEIMAGKDVVNFENRYYGKDGSLVDLQWAASWNKEDQLMYCVARDITELKKMQQELLKSNERFYYATKAAFDVIWEWDLRTNQLMWGENYYLLFGYQPEPANCNISNWYVRIHPSDCERVIQSINQAIESDIEIWSQEYRYKKADGSYVWVCDKGIILREADGRPLRMIGAMQDVTNRKQYEEKLSMNERRFRSLVQESSDMTAIINIDGDYEYVSPSVENVLGLPPEHFLGKNAFQFIHPDDTDAVVVSLKSIYVKDAIVVEPFRFQNANGEWRWIETKLTNQLNNPCIQGIIANSRDITEKRMIQEELRTLALLAKQTTNAVLITDATRKIVWVNESFRQLYRYEWEEIIGRNPQELLSGPDTNQADLDKIKEAIKKPIACQTEIVCYTKHNGKKIIELQTQPIFDGKGKLVNFFSIHHDITTKRKLQWKLIREQKERQKNITKAVISAQERERSEIGKEMHDNVNQLLTTTKLYLELIKKDKKHISALLDKSISYINESINNIRRISHALSYAVVEDLTLTNALIELVDSINLVQKTGVTLSAHFDERKVSHEIKLSIFRIVQEQTNNILNYSKAQHALIELTESEDKIRLKIEDDGVGFDPCKKKSGIGLSNIESRVSAYKGTLKLQSEVGNGCLMIIEFPCL